MNISIFLLISELSHTGQNPLLKFLYRKKIQVNEDLTFQFIIIFIRFKRSKNLH